MDGNIGVVGRFDHPILAADKGEGGRMAISLQAAPKNSPKSLSEAWRRASEGNMVRDRERTVSAHTKISSKFRESRHSD
jgi:hypothetical protein